MGLLRTVLVACVAASITGCQDHDMALIEAYHQSIRDFHSGKLSESIPASSEVTSALDRLVAHGRIQKKSIRIESLIRTKENFSEIRAVFARHADWIIDGTFTAEVGVPLEVFIFHFPNQERVELFRSELAGLIQKNEN